MVIPPPNPPTPAGTPPSSWVPANAAFYSCYRLGRPGPTQLPLLQSNSPFPHMYCCLPPASEHTRRSLRHPLPRSSRLAWHQGPQVPSTVPVLAVPPLACPRNYGRIASRAVVPLSI